MFMLVSATKVFFNTMVKCLSFSIASLRFLIFTIFSLACSADIDYEEASFRNISWNFRGISGGSWFRDFPRICRFSPNQRGLYFNLPYTRVPDKNVFQNPEEIHETPCEGGLGTYSILWVLPWKYQVAAFVYLRASCHSFQRKFWLFLEGWSLQHLQQMYHKRDAILIMWWGPDTVLLQSVHQS